MLRLRKPMNEGKECVQLDREPAIGRRQEEAIAHSHQLADERALTRSIAHVLDDGRREADVELLVLERETNPRGLNERQAWVGNLEFGRVFDTRCRHSVWVGIPSLEEVRVRDSLIGSHPDVEDGRFGGGNHELHEAAVEISPHAQREMGDDAPQATGAIDIVNEYVLPRHLARRLTGGIRGVLCLGKDSGPIWSFAFDTGSHEVPGSVRDAVAAEQPNWDLTAWTQALTSPKSTSAIILDCHRLDAEQSVRLRQ